MKDMTFGVPIIQNTTELNLAITLPDKFLEMLSEAAGPERAAIVASAITESSPELSVRLNPLKRPEDLGYDFDTSDRIPWCHEGCYLSERPDFTLDPLFHAGAYYVQEPSSMFLALLSPLLQKFGITAILDLCASPGGKSTHLASFMPEDAVLWSNEVIKSRVGILTENVTKWGNPNVKVISLDPSQFANSKANPRFDTIMDCGRFDFILVDAPCSGEGMFRKDPGAILHWSEENVKICSARQRRILSDIWPSLAPGGFLAYSTCTFNRYENDLNVTWLKSQFDAELFSFEEFYSAELHSEGLYSEGLYSQELDYIESNIEQTRDLNNNEPDFRHLLSEWGVVTSPEGGFQFFPGIVRGEGFYFVLLRKPPADGQSTLPKPSYGQQGNPQKLSSGQQSKCNLQQPSAGRQNNLSKRNAADNRYISENRYKAEILKKSEKHQVAGKTTNTPEHYEALSSDYSGPWPSVELSRSDALKYLSRESFPLDGAPLGYIRLTYRGLGLGFAKNLGSRINNLYPVNWRIKKKF